jgi:hypothetical protein
MDQAKLFMVLLGCTPKGRNIEQHDMFFGIAPALKDLVSEILEFWPEGEGKIHIDAWREVHFLNGYSIHVQPRTISNAQLNQHTGKNKLFFINLGGYKQNEFEEFHYKCLIVAPDRGVAIQQSMQTAFYRHVGFEGASSHVDDKYGIDVDDIYEIEDILSKSMKMQYRIEVQPTDYPHDDELHLGYIKLDKIG